MQIDDLDTPSVLVDLDRVEANLKRWQDYCDRHGIANRPHIKTHKLVEFARLQVALGAHGIACQKLGEAEVMADAGIDDILIPFNLLGRPKLERAVALAKRIRLILVADHAEVADPIGKAFAEAGMDVEMLVECDTGAKRNGTQSIEETVALARHIAATPGLRFAGLLTYPPPGGQPNVAAYFAETVERLKAHGIEAPILSSGGSPDMWTAHTQGWVTEHRSGTYIYGDRMQIRAGCIALEDCALHVLATVVSRPTADRAILDTGSKALTSDLAGLNGYGRIAEYPDAVIQGLSEEHGHVDLSAVQGPRPRIGERVRILPNHACPVSNLYDHVALCRGSNVETLAKVAARGRLT
ncbi:MAG TPA: D-TA family PLP-dependent enzyme [Geminicoccus sp.]|jgi:D-serine deaminase-like pyridoxal phosphate-dependent protein|uniref:D-TA family PLP-dependent enzyme n=1 Tax=Geminicoccus sp. TaxID=2024832 RepID=UPI002E3352B9|nr:D-TA family PLP-dependent enzyme [Geminicoccus sp.]HEX2527039.1 D-TA family PLP-dependent enzyme [Geminicoccus sp.]